MIRMEALRPWPTNDTGQARGLYPHEILEHFGAAALFGEAEADGNPYALIAHIASTLYRSEWTVDRKGRFYSPWRSSLVESQQHHGEHTMTRQTGPQIIPAVEGWHLLLPVRGSIREYDRHVVVAWRLGTDWTPLPISTAGDVTFGETAAVSSPCGDLYWVLREGAPLEGVEHWLDEVFDPLGEDHLPLDPIDYTALDPRISGAVALLREAGLQTTDSGDGAKPPEAGCTMDVPHVAVVTTHETCVRDAEKICRALLAVGVMVKPQAMDPHRPGTCTVQISWAPGETWTALVMGDGLLDIGGDA